MKKKPKKHKKPKSQEDIISEINQLRTPLIDEWQELRTQYIRTGILTYAQQADSLLEVIADKPDECQRFAMIQGLSSQILGNKEN